jgi:hypothetical protein
MKKLLINFIIIVYAFLGVNNITVLGSGNVQTNNNASDEGSFILREVLLAHQVLANTSASDVDNHHAIIGSIVLLGEKKYKIISFKFENTLNSASDETFEEYARTNNLFNMRSVVTRSPEGDIISEIFDSSKANLDDAVSFNISLSPLI